jgi:hypothetical protein
MPPEKHVRKRLPSLGGKHILRGIQDLPESPAGRRKDRREFSLTPAKFCCFMISLNSAVNRAFSVTCLREEKFANIPSQVHPRLSLKGNELGSSG